MHDAPVTAPGDGEVRVKVEACGVTAADWQLRHGQLKLATPPFVPGFQCSGTVDALGDNVESLQVGQRVLVVHSLRCWVEQVVVPAVDVYPIPESLTFQEAAGLAFDYLTAYVTLFRHANLQKGQRVLIYHASEGIGLAATQLAKTVPEVVVFGVAPEAQHDVIKENGVDHAIDNRAPDCDRLVRETSVDGVDAVVEPALGKDTKKVFNLLKPLGTLIVCGTSNAGSGGFLSAARQKLQSTKFDGLPLIDGNKSVAGVNAVHLLATDAGRDIIQELLSLCQQDKIKPLVDSVFSFRKASEAQKRVHDGANVGAVVLVPVIDEEERAIEEARKKAEAEKAEKAARRSFRRPKTASTSSKSDGEAKADAEGKVDSGEKPTDEGKQGGEAKPDEEGKPKDEEKSDVAEGENKPVETESKPAETTEGEGSKEEPTEEKKEEPKQEESGGDGAAIEGGEQQ